MEQRTPTHFTPQSDPSVGEGLTAEVAAFVLDTGFDAIPGAVVELAKKSILDGFGLALSGSVAASGHMVQKHLADVAKPGGATVIGTSMKVPSRFAAFANGVGIHADDYDDTQLAVASDRVYGLLTHPTAPCLPAAFAEAELRSLSGRDMLAAYLVGVDVECKIAEAISPRHYQHGFHATATCGTFAAASAAGKLRGFNQETLQRALSIAGSQSAGLRENFGTMTKPFHAGRSSESGVVACDMAGFGWSATDKILEAQRGFFQAHGGGYDLNAIRGKLGSPWSFAQPGVSIKPHPSGSLTHPGMTKMLELIQVHGITASDVERVDVGTNHNMLNALIHHRPQNELQAKFSMEFCMAILLLDGRANLPEFTDETVLRDDVKAMIERVNFHVHENAEAAGYAKMTTILKITLKDGRAIEGIADFGRGSPANPMSYDEVAEKFRGCAEFASWNKDKSEQIIELVATLETAKDMRALAAALSN